jgi:signal transduction histidine kinase
MSKNACAEELARGWVAARVELRRAAQVLHDDVGSLLAVAGLRLQLLTMDHPATQGRAAEIGEALDGVMQHLRKLSRELEPSPVRRTGLKNALLDLVESSIVSTGVDIGLRYTATATLAPAAADAMYLAIESAVTAAAGSPKSRRPKNAGRITIAVSGSRSVTARISHAGQTKSMSQDLAGASMLAAHAGLGFEVQVTKKGTIVSISHAIQRSSRG